MFYVSYTEIESWRDYKLRVKIESEISMSLRIKCARFILELLFRDCRVLSNIMVEDCQFLMHCEIVE